MSAPGSTEPQPRVALHTVAHELMHGVTCFSIAQRTASGIGLDTNLAASVRLGPGSFTYRGRTYACGDTRFPIRIRGDWELLPAWCQDGRFILGSSQGSAVNEAYSDIFGVSAGFFHAGAGATGSYDVFG